MCLLRAVVAAAVVACAVPAAAQDQPENRNRRLLPDTRALVMNYSGIYGGFMYGRPLYYTRPRTYLYADDYIAGGRPLGISPNYNYFDAEGRVFTDWNRWPYVATGGRDEAPRAEPTPKADAEAALIEGRALWKAADYEGALSSFKRAVAQDLKNPAARLHMGLALLITGDLKNADKAVASALDLLRAGDELPSLGIEPFRNPKERARFEAKLFPARDGTGTLTVALAQHLLGLKEKAKALLETSEDRAAKKLAGLLR